MILSDAIRN